MKACGPNCISYKRVCQSPSNRHVSSIEEINHSQRIQRPLLHCNVSRDSGYACDFQFRRSKCEDEGERIVYSTILVDDDEGGPLRARALLRTTSRSSLSEARQSSTRT